jgi:hypothetical protein
MPRYRCCFVGKHGEVIGVELFEAADDRGACARAEELVARVGYHAVEVWSHAEMIYCAEKRSRRKWPIDYRSRNYRMMRRLERAHGGRS